MHTHSFLHKNLVRLLLSPKKITISDKKLPFWRLPWRNVKKTKITETRKRLKNCRTNLKAVKIKLLTLLLLVMMMKNYQVLLPYQHQVFQHQVYQPSSIHQLQASQLSKLQLQKLLVVPIKKLSIIILKLQLVIPKYNVNTSKVVRMKKLPIITLKLSRLIQLILAYTQLKVVWMILL